MNLEQFFKEYSYTIYTTFIALLIFMLSRFIMGNSASNKNILSSTGEIAKNIFDFSVENIEHKSIPLQSYYGKKAYLVVNVASK